MEWFWVEDGQQAGPVTEAEFSRLVQEGRITGDTLIWRDGMANWQQYETVFGGGVGVIPPPPPPVPPPAMPQPTEQPYRMAQMPAPPAPGVEYCAGCGRLFPVHDLARVGNLGVCAACRPTFSMPGAPMPSALAATGVEFGGMVRRLLARFFDILLFALPLTIIFISMGIEEFDFWNIPPEVMAASLGVTLLRWIYEVVLLGAFGATLGKKMFGVKVINADGSKLTFGGAVARTSIRLLAPLIPYVGPVVLIAVAVMDVAAIFDEEKRTLPDRICKTRCIRG